MRNKVKITELKKRQKHLSCHSILKMHCIIIAILVKWHFFIISFFNALLASLERLSMMKQSDMVITKRNYIWVCRNIPYWRVDLFPRSQWGLILPQSPLTSPLPTLRVQLPFYYFYHRLGLQWPFLPSSSAPLLHHTTSLPPPRKWVLSLLRYMLNILFFSLSPI